MSVSDVADELDALTGSGFVTKDPGPFGGWGITDGGRRHDDEQIGLELTPAGVRDLVTETHRRFITLNRTLLEVCSDWQLRRIGNAPVLNDHRDVSYDVAVLDRLGRVHDEVVPLLEDLATRIDRFSLYLHRLASALTRSLGGEVDAVADGLDSYHAVWFQLHEDLLTTLGLSREEERRRFTGDGQGQPG
jgi:hypothetical protein